MHHSRPISHMYGYNGFTYLYLLILLRSLSFASAQTRNDTAVQNPYANPNFKPSMAVTIVVLVGAFIFMGFFSIYIRHCTEQGRNGGGSVRPINVGRRSRRVARGLDLEVIETFPTFIYSVVKGLKIGKGALECAVCLNEFEDDETLRLIPKCDHVFHPECIDVWLDSHTTCPVCRANLKPDVIQVTDSDNISEDENVSSEVNQLQNQVSIRVIDDQIRDSVPDVINPNQIPVQNRPARATSMKPNRFFGNFPRSHSTGHSIVQPGENCERFTLKLPEDVRKQIVNGKLNRTTSCITFPTRQGSISGGSIREGSSRWKSFRFGRSVRAANSDRWMFSMAPPFFWRTSSVRSQKIGEGSVKLPFESSGAKSDVVEQPSSVRPPV